MQSASASGVAPGGAGHGRHGAVHGAARPKPQMSAEERRWHFSCFIGKPIAPCPGFEKGRYVPQSLLGVGVYGKVFLCHDLKHDSAPIALKVVRKDTLYRRAALNEVKILQLLSGAQHCVRLLRAFDMQGHISMSMELQGETLTDYVQRNGPLPVEEVRVIGRTLLEALDAVHARSVIHTDMKPDNVLLRRGCSEPSAGITLVDFGSAVQEGAWKQSLIGTREYRAPEAILQIEWGKPADVWGAGCVIAELALGRQLFASPCDQQHLPLIEKVRSPAAASTDLPHAHCLPLALWLLSLPGR
jgi:dual-specificity kinase